MSRVIFVRRVLGGHFAAAVLDATKLAQSVPACAAGPDLMARE
jgi:hypothetical protein